MTRIVLTVAEIMDLACFAGLTLTSRFNPSGDDLDAKIVVAASPKGGIHDADTGRYVLTKHIAYFEEYCDEGCIALGPEETP